MPWFQAIVRPSMPITRTSRISLIEHADAAIYRDFTSGYLFKQRKVVNDRFSGNQGILAARVLHYDARRKRLCLEALIELHQQDGIRIGNQDHGLLLNKIYVQNKLVNRVEKGTVFEIEDPLSVKRGLKFTAHWIISLKKYFPKDAITRFERSLSECS